jgi:hypothetical protein
VDTPDQGHIHPKRGWRGRFERSADGAQRDAQATELRGRGMTYRAIADTLGLHDASAARKAVERAMVATVAEPCEALRRLELLRLDTMAVAAWQVLDAPHPLISAGRIMALNGEPLTDPQPVLASIDRLLRIAERRARLLGLDAPVQVDGGVLSIAEIDRQLAVLDAELAARPDPDADDD